jgi:hypothetical protein
MGYKTDVVLVVTPKQKDILTSIEELKDFLQKAEVKHYKEEGDIIFYHECWGYYWEMSRWNDIEPPYSTLLEALQAGEYNLMLQGETLGDEEIIFTNGSIHTGVRSLSLP